MLLKDLLNKKYDLDIDDIVFTLNELAMKNCRND